MSKQEHDYERLARENREKHQKRQAAVREAWRKQRERKKQ